MWWLETEVLKNCRYLKSLIFFLEQPENEWRWFISRLFLTNINIECIPFYVDQTKRNTLIFYIRLKNPYQNKSPDLQGSQIVKKLAKL